MSELANLTVVTGLPQSVTILFVTIDSPSTINCSIVVDGSERKGMKT